MAQARTQTRSQSLLICSSKATKDWGEMMSRSRGRLGRAKEKKSSPIFVRPSFDATRSSQDRLRSDWERVWYGPKTRLIRGIYWLEGQRFEQNEQNVKILTVEVKRTKFSPIEIVCLLIYLSNL